MDPYEHLVRVRDRPLDLLETQNVRRAIPVVNNRSHPLVQSSV
jgi:hypothetical protein